MLIAMIHLENNTRHLGSVAEREGFEPSDESPRRWFSRPVHSTALPPLRKNAQNTDNQAEAPVFDSLFDANIAV